MTRQPTALERALWQLALRRYRWATRQTPTGRVLQAHGRAQSAVLRAMAGLPPPPAPPDPTLCPCGHSIGVHTDHPTGYGCTRCLCVQRPYQLLRKFNAN